MCAVALYMQRLIATKFARNAHIFKQRLKRMNVTAPSRTISAAQKVEHFDVLIVGAGISGVGSAYHLTRQMPGTTFVALEEQETFGGTWWTHKYPGIRSDSPPPPCGYI